MLEKLNRPKGTPLSGLATVRDSKRKRSSSWDKTGRNHDWIIIPGGKSASLADIKGAGCIHHIWITINGQEPQYLRKLVLRMFWDNEKYPSVEAPVGDFFGVGHGLANHYVSLPLNMVKGKGVGSHAAMNCFFPMPFASRARIEIENQSTKDIPNFYFYIDYEQYDDLAEDVGRFHACFHIENPAKPVLTKLSKHKEVDMEVNLTGKDNYVILDAKGQGHYVGCILSVDNHQAFNQRHTWFGEGDDMIFIDGEKWPPSLHGTGTEDYFCAAWGFPSGEYSGPYHGISLAGDIREWSGKWTAYRFHIEDPVRFKKSIRVTIEHGHANNQGNDYSSVAYWYQFEPHKKFKSLPPPLKRLAR